MRFTLWNILLVLLCMSGSCSLAAKGFSYVYIQGDKSVPFYVKFEEQMLPRYGKNYNIIPQLAPGPINIQVLFQQNAYPAQKFTIMVPENGFRGFLLLKKGEGFALYDIHQQFYLQPGNKAEDDKAPPANTADAFVYTNTAAPAENTTKPALQPEGTKLKFLPNVELNNERRIETKQPRIQEEPAVEEALTEEAIPVEQEEPVATTTGNAGMVVANSDCPGAISDNDFEALYSKVQDKSEKTKLKYMLTRMDDCYSSNQARMLAEALGNDPERYIFLKRVYPRVTDQYNFPPLENLLSTQEWKSYFKLILPK